MVPGLCEVLDGVSHECDQDGVEELTKGSHRLKISICGKGGSGKSVVTCLLAGGIRRRGLGAVVVDSDESNSGLYRMLGLDEPPVPLLEIVGGKKQVFTVLAKDAGVRPAADTNIMLRDELHLSDVPAEHVVRSDGLSLIGVGKILHSLEGCACPMGVLSREFLGKLRLGDDEVAVVDMEAGVEHFGRGVDTSIDAVLIVVDPSYEALEIVERIAAMTRNMSLRGTWAVLNKLPNDEVARKLETQVNDRGVPVIGLLRADSQVFEACLEGAPVDSDLNRPAVDAILDSLGVADKRTA